MEDRSQRLRSEFAGLVAARTKGRNPAVEQVFASVKREAFAGPGPWSVAMLSATDFVRTPDDDPAHLYQDVLIALDPARNLNIGLPSGHAIWLDAIDVKAGDHVVQVGAGTGYYTAILAHLVGGAGRVDAFEIEPDLAARASDSLRHLPQVQIHPRSGLAGDLPKADLIYVCVGTMRPYQVWLDAMRPGARLLFPLQPHRGAGGMLLIRRAEQGMEWPARFLSRASFVCADGSGDADTGDRLAEAFTSNWKEVRSFQFGDAKDETCWFAGKGWWLSTKAIDAGCSI